VRGRIKDETTRHVYGHDETEQFKFDSTLTSYQPSLCYEANVPPIYMLAVKVIEG